MSKHSFSDSLDKWLASRQPKTLDGLTRLFKEKSFAFVFLLLMAIPALPIPTGGITHVFEVIVMLLALELIIGRSTIWLPKWWRHKKLGPKLIKTGLPKLVSKIRWVERYARPRLGGVINSRLFLRLVGVFVLVLTLAAFLSPPFSGLDTLPSLGVVLMSLGLILEDALLFVFGLVVGAAGIGVIIALGDVISNAFKHLL